MDFLKKIVSTGKKSLAIVGSAYSAYGIIIGICSSAKGELVENLQFVNSLEFTPTCALQLLVVSFAVFLGFDLIQPYYFNKEVFQDKGGSVRVKFQKNILKNKDGAILVGINDALNCNEKDIPKTSLHWQLIHRANLNKRSDANHATWIEAAFEEAKKNRQPDKDGLYPMGYAFAAMDDQDEQQYVFLVTAHLDVSNSSTTTPEQVSAAVYKLFTTTDGLPRLKNDKLYTPPIGTGSGGLTDLKQDVALQIATALARSKSESSTRVSDLVIVFRKKMLTKVDMAKLSANIKDCVKHCPNCKLF